MIYRALVLALLLSSCAKNSVNCTTIYNTPVNRQLSENNSKCQIGEVLVGYDTTAVGGPLICASATTSCPVPSK